MKEKFHALNAATKGFAIPIIILCIIFGGPIFILAPSYGIAGAIHLIHGGFETALTALQIAIIPTAFNIILGGLWLANACIDALSPVPAERTRENNEHPCWKRRNIVWWTSIISLIVVVLAAWIVAVTAFKIIETAALASGIMFIVLHSVGMLIFAAGGLGFLFFGEITPEVTS